MPESKDRERQILTILVGLKDYECYDMAVDSVLNKWSTDHQSKCI